MVLLRKLFLLLVASNFLSLISIGQNQVANTHVKGGINFEQTLSWSEILQKAKTENKYVFVDCYATWCVPCKKMDEDIYPNDSVGAVVNDNFIAVKVQMDTSKNDNEQIQRWYKSAQEIKSNYRVNAYPTYLFFSPSGEIVHRFSGYLSVAEFASLAEIALDTAQQFYTQWKKLQNQTPAPAELLKLLNTASRVGDSKLLQTTAVKYVKDLLSRKDTAEIFQKDNLFLIMNTSSKSTDAGFKFIRDNAEKINRVINIPNAAQRHIYTAIYNQEIAPVIQQTLKVPNKEINWKTFQRKLKKKYTHEFAYEPALYGKMTWYQHRQNWQQYTKSIVNYVKEFKSTFDNDAINNYAWEVFKYSPDTNDLEEAASWMKIILATVKNDPLSDEWDTYANLLYKSGKVKEAVEAEERAIGSTNSEQKIKQFNEMLEIMKAGKPTWIFPKDSGAIKN